MTSLVLFYMPTRFRQYIIECHQFYIEQAENRLLSQFQNIGEETDKYMSDWSEKTEQYFDPDRDDIGDIYEQANDKEVDFYQMLEDMQTRTRLSIVASIFHEWEKQLKSWMIDEMYNWGCGNNVKKAVWKAPFMDIIKLLQEVGWEVERGDYYASLDKCRLIVNVYKHGDGRSFECIRKKHPDILQGPEDYLEYTSHVDLAISEKHISECSKAIIDFWKDVPAHIFLKKPLNCPKWFKSAYDKDQT